MLKTILFPQLQKSLGVTRRPFPENYGEIPKMDFINLPLPNVNMRPGVSYAIVENRGKIAISNDIADRPAGAQNRSRRGHWEGDTVAGKTGKACFVTLVERKMRFLVGGKSSAKRAADVNEVMWIALEGRPVKSITPDRGKEFAKHAEVTEALEGVKFYFPPPHHPWERGSNENTNGLLREYFPKGQDITDIPDAYIQEMFDK